MQKYEFDDVKIYLKNILLEEEMESENIVFFKENFVDFIPLEFNYLGNSEFFFIIIKIDEYAIYFNDIEEDFGICKIYNQKCTEYAEYYSYLNPTISKLKALFF
jgi:hypothetical protein